MLILAAPVGGIGCGSDSPLNDGGAAGAGGRDASDGDRTMATAGAGGNVPVGYCNTFADCELRSGCCGSSCDAKTDPPSGVTICATSCASVTKPAPPTCGCVNHVCSNATACIIPGTISCPSCPAGYLTGADGCPTCLCKPLDAGTENGAGTDAATTLPACTWPASLDATDAGAGACRPSRTLLACSAADGSGEDCLSDNPDHCDGDSATPGVVYTCHPTCAAHEYAVVCGSIGPGPISDPPAGCHDPLATPAGIVFYCCPCL